MPQAARRGEAKFVRCQVHGLRSRPQHPPTRAQHAPATVSQQPVRLRGDDERPVARGGQIVEDLLRVRLRDGDWESRTLTASGSDRVEQGHGANSCA
jgi:hypothetical protein